MKKRVEWIDSLRGLAMFLVILGHSFYIRNNKIRNYLYSFHMPLFFFISGLTTKRKDISFIEFIKKKAKNLLLPYLFLNIFIFIFKYILHVLVGMYKGLSLSLAVEYFFRGYENYIPCIQSWFILCLFVIEVIYFIFMKITKNDIQLTVLVLITFFLGYKYTLTDYTNLQYWHIDTALIGILFYYFGYMLMKYIDKISFILKSYWSIILLLILFPLGYHIQYMNGRISMNVNRYNNVNYFIIAASITILAIVILTNLIMKKDVFFKKVGIMSLFYLGYHGFIITPIKTFAHEILENNIYVILIAALTFIVMYPISKLVYRYCPIMIGKFKKEEI